METFTRWVYYFLESLGLDLSYMTNLNRLIVLVLIAVLAFLTDWICRKGIVRLVRKVTQKTKVTWDDLLFNDRVMNNFCHILPPVVVYILLPIAFPDGSDALAFIRKLCMVYIIAAALRFINIFLGVIFQLATQKEDYSGRFVFCRFDLHYCCIDREISYPSFGWFGSFGCYFNVGFQG